MKRIKIRSKLPKPVTHDQWIEIRRKDGQTVTTFYPPNEEFEKLRLEMDPPPDLIYRRLIFFQGVPAEYRWTQPGPQARYGGHFLQRLKVADWLRLLHDERALNSPHALRGHNHQPRPEAFGPCPCPRCSPADHVSNLENISNSTLSIT